MAASTTSQVYIDVIEDVMVKVRDEFVNTGASPGDEVLRELQAIWESKCIQAGAVLGPIERNTGVNRPMPGGPITPVHDLNVPYEGTEEYETPTAEILFPPTPLQTPIQTPLPGPGETPNYNIPTGPSDYSSGNDAGGNADVKGGRQAFMPPPSPWMNMNQRPPLDVNVAYVEGRDEADRGASNQPMTQDFFTMTGGKRKRNDLPPPYDAGGYIPQQDGAGDAVSGDFEIESREELNGRLETWRQALVAYGFRLSRSKTEYMECNFSKRRSGSTLEVKVGDYIIPQVARFKYLGSIVQNVGEIEADVNHRIQAGWLKT
uniref:Transcription factor IIA, helical n=1 Tax=Medicago truncatula TaxID=3880 RepID=Q2HS28_MEDTR|nr:Transcription factor IIA, helical [Medicago truncatula]